MWALIVDHSWPKGRTIRLELVVLQVVVGGGQEASQVTTTAGKAGRFESRFFHKVLPP